MEINDLEKSLGKLRQRAAKLGRQQFTARTEQEYTDAQVEFRLLLAKVRHIGKALDSAVIEIDLSDFRPDFPA